MTRTVLVIEDNALMREIYRATLEAEGCRMLDAPDLATARRLAAGTAAIDLAIVDLHLPDGLGTEAWRDMAAGFERPPPAILVTTAEVDAQAPDAGLFAAHLRKPVNPADLLALLRQMLDAP